MIRPKPSPRPTAAIVRYRQLKGLLRAWRRHWGIDGARPIPIPDWPEEGRFTQGRYRNYWLNPRRYERDWVGSFAGTKRPRGICCWCGEPCGPNAHYWHTSCVKAFSAARGFQRNIHNGRPLPAPSRWTEHTVCRCAGCGHESNSPYDFDVDHRVALSVAWASQDWRTILRAYMLDNLQFLCAKCHRAKTAADRIALTAIKKSRRPLVDVHAVAAPNTKPKPAPAGAPPASRRMV